MGKTLYTNLPQAQCHHSAVEAPDQFPDPSRMPQGTFFFFIWTTPPATFLARHYRCIESICRHHPRGVIRGLSNTLPTSFFDELKRADVACDVEIERYDLAQLVQGSIAQVW